MPSGDGISGRRIVWPRWPTQRRGSMEDGLLSNDSAEDVGGEPPAALIAGGANVPAPAGAGQCGERIVVAAPSGVGEADDGLGPGDQTEWAAVLWPMPCDAPTRVWSCVWRLQAGFA